MSREVSFVVRGEAREEGYSTELNELFLHMRAQVFVFRDFFDRFFHIVLSIRYVWLVIFGYPQFRLSEVVFLLGFEDGFFAGFLSFGAI